MTQAAITVYGIPNCDTVKKARAWLTEQGLAYEFHDFKKQGVPADQLPLWLAAAGLDVLLNRKGTTWRKLDAETQASAQSEAGAVALMQEQPSVIKRPVVRWPNAHISVGFAPEAWSRLQEQTRTK
ncbi:ArsC family reductase [Comamonas composti]|uniref:ArsC family reductase n=1 Tax=Comamonas composti TaxID=408558 RepID=UPI00040C65D8|nr:ArsC family reductase [Comamonas composti]